MKPVITRNGHIAMERGVSSFPLGPIVSLSLPSCITLLVSLQIHQLMAAQFRVTGPAQPIIVSVGEAAVLPCCLSPRMNAEDMEVRWFRSWFSPYVHLYRHRRDQYAQQMPEYQRRTWLIKDDITSGSVFLIICSVRPSDHGQYKCSFQSGSSYEEALLDLQVTAMGSGPHISADGYQDGGIQVGCRSAGWYPEPKAHWRDHRGQLLPTTFEEISMDTDGLFHTEISIIIMEESNRKVTCCVRNPLLNQEKTATVDIADHFFTRVSPTVVALAVILGILVFVIVLGGFCLWRLLCAKGALQSELEREKRTLQSKTESGKAALQSELEIEKGSTLAFFQCSGTTPERQEFSKIRARGWATMLAGCQGLCSKVCLN
ncbi:butyrophilin subfamily 1 member A1 isoform X3 [Alligator mississippiensis]|uniref:butyrophilin subfamily 1 member A1 isoform X3 n=1 Tax=Alligator mississippiensis TaxID=8496 RepID=UPI002877D939|nr:butyrophilin subfamily 1 member A1 isoform X3 [Alligator mississippiensis]